MQMLKMDGYYVCAPETEILGMTLATMTKDWVAIGAVGDQHSLLLDAEEWPAFVQFVNELSQVRLNEYA